MTAERIQSPRSNGASATSLRPQFLEIDETILPVREEIVVSWFRSVRSGVRADHLEAPYDADVDGHSRLTWAAR